MSALRHYLMSVHTWTNTAILRSPHNITLVSDIIKILEGGVKDDDFPYEGCF